MMRIFEPYRFSVLDVENLRLHYVETLKHWLQRFEQSADIVCEEFGRKFERTWRLYLCGSQAAFEAGGLQLFQVVFARYHNNEIPRTRTHVYQPAADHA
jgi:cyclopropane-fatty-acyl-phospholipid synthase